MVSQVHDRGDEMLFQSQMEVELVVRGGSLRLSMVRLLFWDMLPSLQI